MSPSTDCVLFAGKQARASRWRIWRIGVDGQGLRAVSAEHMDARSPIRVSTLFAPDSPEPWFTTVFVAMESTLNELGHPPASSLYNIQLDGTELRRLTFNPNRNFDPFQMWDGRIIYSAERHPLHPGRPPGRIGLHSIHIEGADMEFYGGADGKRIQEMSCATGDGLVVFVESDPPARDGAGQLACLEEHRPHHTYRSLSNDLHSSFFILRLCPTIACSFHDAPPRAWAGATARATTHASNQQSKIIPPPARLSSPPRQPI